MSSIKDGLPVTVRVVVFEEQARADAADLTFAHDCNSVCQGVCFFHGVRGEKDDSAAFHSFDHLPNLPAGLRVHASLGEGME